MNVGVLSARELAAERRLIEASQRDRNRFGQLYERYFHRVYAFAITRTRDRAAAEDVTAETFRRALQNLSHFQWRGGPLSARVPPHPPNAAPALPPRGAPPRGRSRGCAAGQKSAERCPAAGPLAAV